jgi:hypothetical protein
MSIFAVTLALLGCVSVPGGSTATLGNSLNLLAVLALQVEQPTTAPATTNPALWASLIWILLGVVMLVLLVGAALFAVRRSADRRVGRRLRE